MTTNAYVLITHGGQHGGVASYLAGDLERQGVRAVLRPAEPGSAQQALFGAAALVALVGHEPDAGVARRDAEAAAHAGKMIYGVRLAGGAGQSLSGLPVRQWVDAFGPNAPANVSRMAGELRTYLLQGAGPPRAPMPQPQQHAQAAIRPPLPPSQPGPAGWPAPPGPQYAPARPAPAPHGFPPARHGPPGHAAPPAQAFHPAQPSSVGPAAPPQHPFPPAQPIPQAQAAPPAQASAPAAVAPAPLADPPARPKAAVQPDVEAFESKRCEPGETVLAWIEASQGDSQGVAILTDRRLCFYGKSGKGVRLQAISVQTTQLRYNPDRQPQGLEAHFETEQGEIRFSVAAALADAELGNFLGNLKDLRDAQAALRDAGYVRKATSQDEAPRPEYGLMRLKEMVNQGLLTETEYLAQRASFIEAACRGG